MNKQKCDFEEKNSKHTKQKHDIQDTEKIDSLTEDLLLKTFKF